MSLLFHTRTSQTEKGSAPQALWFLSYLKRLFLIPPTRSATADDARPFTLISSPYIHQTGKIDYFLSLSRCWSNSGVTVAGNPTFTHKRRMAPRLLSVFNGRKDVTDVGFSGVFAEISKFKFRVRAFFFF